MHCVIAWIPTFVHKKRTKSDPDSIKFSKMCLKFKIRLVCLNYLLLGMIYILKILIICLISNLLKIIFHINIKKEAGNLRCLLFFKWILNDKLEKLLHYNSSFLLIMTKPMNTYIKRKISQIFSHLILF